MVVGPVATPTCEAPEPLELKNTRSPAWTSDFEMLVPWPYWAKLLEPSEMPAALKANAVRPEQSNPSGPLPADAYGLPICPRAASTAALTPEGCAGASDGLPPSDDGAERGLAALLSDFMIALRVLGSSRPVASRSCSLWKSRIPARVFEPAMPSASRPSFSWTSRSVARRVPVAAVGASFLPALPS